MANTITILRQTLRVLVKYNIFSLVVSERRDAVGAILTENTEFSSTDRILTDFFSEIPGPFLNY